MIARAEPGSDRPAVERTQQACRRIASLALAASMLQSGSTPPEAMLAEVVVDLLETIEELALHGERWLDEAQKGGHHG